jgi:hypothetical protein
VTGHSLTEAWLALSLALVALSAGRGTAAAALAVFVLMSGGRASRTSAAGGPGARARRLTAETAQA